MRKKKKVEKRSGIKCLVETSCQGEKSAVATST